MGGAVGADIEILVWLLLLANWLERLVRKCFVERLIHLLVKSYFLSPGWQGWGPR